MHGPRLRAPAALALVLLLAAPGEASARARLQPPAGRVLHGGGQEAGDFESYSGFLGARGPAVKMFYIGLGGLNETAPGTVAPWFKDALAGLVADAGADGAFIVPQIGLQLPLNGEERRVADGEYDNAIAALVLGLRSLARPAFLRIGYEFNGQWNGYAPVSYVGAYRRIAAQIRGDAVLNATVALTWDGSCDTKVDPTPFFPGADVVDWQGVNVFSGDSDPSAISPQDCLWFWLSGNAASGTPLMIGESTPRGRNATDSATWSWFEAVASMLDAYPVVQLVNYIDTNWITDEGGRWPGWGDSRVEVPGAAYVGGRWTAELGKSRWANRANRSELLALLGVGEAAAPPPPPPAPPQAPPLPPHPRVMLNDSALAELRATIAADATARAYYSAVLAHGNALLNTPPIAYPNCTVVGACRNAAVFGKGAQYINAGGARDAVQTCALLHRLGLDNATGGGPTVWSDRALRELDALVSFPSWYWPVGQALERAGLAFTAAVGYDWLFDLLSAAQRAALEDAMGARVLHTRDNDELQSMWWVNDLYNWNTNAQAPLLGVTVALADVPAWADLAARVQGFVLASVPQSLASWAPEGVWPESPGYQEYTISELVHGASALVTATGSDAGLLGGPGICGAGLVSTFNTGPSLTVFNRGDAGAGPPGAAPLFFLSRHCNLPVLAAFARQLPIGRTDSASDDLIFYSSAGSDADILALPLARAFADPSLDRSRGAKTHFVSFREAWLQPKAAWVALKGGDNYFSDGGSNSHNNHGHLDVGSFVLESDGVRWVIDLGGGAYDYPLLAYFGRFRFGYAFTSSTTHNVLSFDDVTQNRRGQGRIVASGGAVATAVSGGGGDAAGAGAGAEAAWAQLDLTSAYGGAASVLRNVSLAGRVTTIADTFENPRASVVRFQFLTTAAVELGGASVTLRDAKSGAALKVSGSSLRGAAVAWAAPRLELATPQTDTYGGEAVFVVSFAVPASEGGLTVIFEPQG